ncbi:MAG: sulfite exporter TauE/SafE family protein [Methylocystis sp.]|nr:sulfite exporter TauE/SafE family protein [Methylocystis sp.]MCA3582671.1 sulfite exporter TauE/SafE family protein [Methylocystis sp.]MCA3588674.1 sulfite exporter TauE/SafE family protein [Methylocystis sp.]MCA3591968.1 sulfite exporter TauE/SafE family protein [Methylocystis sp.]
MFGIPLNELAYAVAGLIAGGVATGLLAGLFGVGGGAIIVPVIYAVFGLMHVPEELRMPLSVGTSLAVIIPTSIQSFRTHYAKGAVDMAVLKLWAAPVVLGVLVGSGIARYAPPGLFKIVFVAIASLIAAKLFFGSERWKLGDTLPAGLPMRLYGVIIGVLSSLMGIGGGQLASVFMTAYGAPIHRAIATSSGLGVLISIPGAIGFMAAGWPRMAELPPLSIGFVSLIGVLLIAPTSTFFAPYGARLAYRLRKRQLEIAFGIFLVLVCLRFLWSLVF